MLRWHDPGVPLTAADRHNLSSPVLRLFQVEAKFCRPPKGLGKELPEFLMVWGGEIRNKKTVPRARQNDRPSGQRRGGPSAAQGNTQLRCPPIHHNHRSRRRCTVIIVVIPRGRPSGVDKVQFVLTLTTRERQTECFAAIATLRRVSRAQRRGDGAANDRAYVANAWQCDQ